jgi:hypothetical protein
MRQEANGLDFRPEKQGLCFRVFDFGLACYLKALGFLLFEAKRIGNRVTYVFGDAPGRKEAIYSFFNRQGEVNANSLLEAIKELKAMAQELPQDE